MGNVDGSAATLQVGSIPDEVILFFDGPNPSSHSALESTQPLTKSRIRSPSRGKERPVR
jgi:hypothetical protein